MPHLRDNAVSHGVEGYLLILFHRRSPYASSIRFLGRVQVLEEDSKTPCRLASAGGWVLSRNYVLAISRIVVRLIEVAFSSYH